MNEITTVITKYLGEYFKRRYPYTPKFKLTKEELDEVADKSVNMQGITLFAQLFLLVGLTALYMYMFFNTYTYLLSFTNPKPGMQFIYIYKETSWTLPGLMLSIATFSYPLEWIQRLFVGAKYEMHEDFFYATKGYDGKKVLKDGNRLFFVLFLITILPITYTGIVFDANGMKMRQYFQIAPQNRAFSDVGSVTYYPFYISSEKDRREIYHPHYLIMFKDGSQFNTFNWTSNNPETIPLFVSQLQKNGAVLDTQRVHFKGSVFF